MKYISVVTCQTSHDGAHKTVYNDQTSHDGAHKTVYNEQTSHDGAHKHFRSNNILQCIKKSNHLVNKHIEKLKVTNPTIQYKGE